MIALTPIPCCGGRLDVEWCEVCGGTRHRATLGALRTSGARWAWVYGERCLARGAWPERWPYDVADAACRLLLGPARTFDGESVEMRAWMAAAHHGAAVEAWGRVVEQVRAREGIERRVWGRAVWWVRARLTDAV